MREAARRASNAHIFFTARCSFRASTGIVPPWRLGGAGLRLSACGWQALRVVRVRARPVTIRAALRTAGARRRRLVSRKPVRVVAATQGRGEPRRRTAAARGIRSGKAVQAVRRQRGAAARSAAVEAGAVEAGAVRARPVAAASSLSVARRVVRWWVGAPAVPVWS